MLVGLAGGIWFLWSGPVYPPAPASVPVGTARWASGAPSAGQVVKRGNTGWGEAPARATGHPSVAVDAVPVHPARVGSGADGLAVDGSDSGSVNGWYAGSVAFRPVGDRAGPVANRN